MLRIIRANYSCRGGFTINEQLFASIYKEAQKDVSVEVPVYASDGSTIVGVYEVDRM